MARTVLIEFTSDTFDADGDVKREKGDRLRVDPGSARSLVEVKKVAARVESPETRPTGPVSEPANRGPAEGEPS